MVRVLFSFWFGWLTCGYGLVGFWIGCLTISLGLFCLLAGGIFIFRLAGFHVARVLSTWLGNIGCLTFSLGLV